MMHITLKQLLVFCSVYRTGQAGKSAREMHISTPAVSQNLHELERQLNTTFFERTGSGLVPTDAARRLWPYANLVIEKTTQIESLFEAEHQGIAGHLRIGANKTFGIYILSRRLPLFRKNNPAISVELSVNDNQAVLNAVLDNTLDVGFVYGDPACAGIEATACFEDRLCIVGSVTGQYCFSNLRPEDLATATWILDEEQQVREMTLKYLKKRAIPVNDSIIMGTMGAIKRAVATGLGVALVPHLAVREEMMRGEIVEILKPTPEQAYTQTIYAITRQGERSKLVERLLEGCDIRSLN